VGVGFGAEEKLEGGVRTVDWEVLFGMHPRYADQIGENVALARELAA
jgi:hypothetical protein